MSGIKGLERRGLRRGGERGAVARLDALIRELRPDVIQVNDVADPALLELVAASGRGVMMIQDHRAFCPGPGKVLPDDRPCRQPMGPACLGCFDDPDYARRMIDLTARRLAALKGMARVTVLSRYMRDELIGAGLAPGRVVHLPPIIDGLPREPPPPPSTAPRGGYHLIAGRLARHKGIDVALEAARRLTTPLPLVLLGEGPLAGQVAQAAASEPARVRWLPWADRAGVAAWLRHATSLWLPSLWAEPFGIVGVEALALGTPVIASDVGGVPDWLPPNEEHGLRVPPGDAAALSAAADRLVSDPGTAQEMGARGRTFVQETHEPERLIKKLLAVYQEVAPT
jgi:glycosyltransferase involved in cell wall biosynthesis